jgi:hypothetical protein
MQNLSQYLDERLLDWATWYLKYNDGGMGYPPITIEGKLMKMGVIIRVQGATFIDENKEAEEMERWICQMYRWKPKLYLAVRAYFLGQIYKIEGNVLQIDKEKTRKLTRNPSKAQISEAMRISVKMLEGYLREAKDFLAGHYLESLERQKKAA